MRRLAYALVGRITRDGRPFPETVVIATPQLERSNFFVVSGPDGRYAFDALAPGAYHLVVFLGRNKDMVMRPVEVAVGRRTEADAEVRTGTSTLTVRVTGEERGSVNARVMLVSGIYQPSPGATLDNVIDGRRMTEPTILFIREASAAPAVFDGLVQGLYTACAATRLPGSDRIEQGFGTAPVRCATRELSSDGELALTLPPVQR
jgi:hypothetical protein